MASLHEYFVKDGSKTLTYCKTVPIKAQDGSVLLEIVAKLHFDFDANAKYVSFYIPTSDRVPCPEAIVLNSLGEILKWPETELQVFAGFPPERFDARDLVFTGRVFLYSERPVPDKLKGSMLAEAKTAGRNLVFRSVEYVMERNKWEKPRAFISHDSRDKAAIAEPLAIKLQQLLCTVWYDEFSLKIGDSLRERIEAGLKECDKCILILTPNFLRNGGWSKREYDSIFTRELVEKRNVILPVWDKVSSKDVYEYSPILADRVAAKWSWGEEKVARKLLSAIGP